jgi:hypothetical protein
VAVSPTPGSTEKAADEDGEYQGVLATRESKAAEAQPDKDWETDECMVVPSRVEAWEPDPVPESPVILALPEGFYSEPFEGDEGSGVLLTSGDYTAVFIFIPNLEIEGSTDILGERGLLYRHGWTRLEAGRVSQPHLSWATEVIPYSSDRGLEGAIWVGESNGRAFRVTVRASKAELDEVYARVTPTLQSLRLK